MTKYLVLLTLLALLLQPGLASLPGASAQAGNDGPQFPTDQTLYVKPSATGNTSCDSWANACLLQSALGFAVSGDQIWVQEGTYKPTQSADRAVSFVLKSGVKIYGGFAGTESSLEQRDWSHRVTILSGDIGVVGDKSDNSYHVLTGDNVSNTSVLDGFTITGGKANDWVDPSHAVGGGLYLSNSSPLLMNLIIRGNSASNMGGGIFMASGSAALTNIAFSGNTAPGGAAVNIFNHSSPVLTNVTFSGNTATRGGAIDNYYSNALVRNCIFWGNTGGEITNPNPNSVTTVTYSVVQGGYAGTGNKDSDPLFERNPSPGLDGTWGTSDDDYGDLRLLLPSPAIDAGDNTVLVPAGVTTDLQGHSRFAAIRSVPDTGHGTPPVVDMGAYEVQNVFHLPFVRK